MAQQQFSAVFREALRNAHGDRCIYCGRHLLFWETKVDHVVPESSLNDSVKLAKMKQQFGLPDSFDLLGYENLAPSCEPCNGQKSDLLLNPGYIAVLLARIQKAIPKLLTALEQRQAEIRLDKLFRMAAIGVDRKDFSVSALLKVMNQFAAESEVPESTHRIVGTLHAQARAAERGINYKVLYEIVADAIRSGGITHAQRLVNSNRYALRGPNNLRIVYEIAGDKIVILTAYHRSEACNSNACYEI